MFLLTFHLLKVYADMNSSESPQITIPTVIIVTSYRPDIVIHNTYTSTVVLLELKHHLDFDHHLELARFCKQNKVTVAVGRA